jgi:hypothetical protein
LIEKYSLKKLNYYEIKKLLGEPDGSYNDGDYIFLDYIIENNCFTQDNDVCMLTISFYKKRNPNFSILCS